MSTREEMAIAVQRKARIRDTVPKGCQPIFERVPFRRLRKISVPSMASHARPQAMKKAATASSERNLAMRKEDMVETAMERGRLQKMRSTKERVRNPCRSANHAARYPGQMKTGMKAGMARRLPTTCSPVMDMVRSDPLLNADRFKRS